MFRFGLTGAFLWFSIKASFISFFYDAEKISKWFWNWSKAPFVIFPKQDVLSYCQRPTDTKVKYFKLNKQNNWWMSKVAYVSTETDDLPLFTVCPNPSLKWSYKHSMHHVIVLVLRLSSPRAESARAVTGRRCPHSGKGEDFLTGQPDFFTETAVTPEREVKK